MKYDCLIVDDKKEALLTYEGALHIIEKDKLYDVYYFDSKVKASKIIDKYKDKYDGAIRTTLDKD